jgi:hypothetical protein
MAAEPADVIDIIKARHAQLVDLQVAVLRAHQQRDRYAQKVCYPGLMHG